MPRPDLHSGRTGWGRSSNPVTGWLASRKRKREEAEEEASRLITNEIVKNESLLIDGLSAINFIRSRLPENILTAKSNEKQPCCDLEYTVRGLIRELQRQPQTIQIDIRKIDEQLLKLVQMLHHAVDQGDTRAAYAAKSALVRGVRDIRRRIPENQPEFAKLFVEQNAKYLSEWVTIVEMSRIADSIDTNIAEQRVQLQERSDEIEMAKNEIKAMLLSDDDTDVQYKMAYQKMLDHSSPEERRNWDETQRALFKSMLDIRMDRVKEDVNQRLLQSYESKISETEGRLDVLYAKVAGLKVVEDPNLMNKYQEELDDLIKILAEGDQQLDETLRAMDDLEGRLAQLDLAPGSVRALEVASEESERILDELKKEQEIEAGLSRERVKNFRQHNGIMTEEELQNLRREILEQEQQREEELRREQEQEQEQHQHQLYN